MKASMTPETIAVKLDAVTKRFGDTVALHEAWLKVRSGEFMTLLGPSGCGKTTILNLVAGFLECDAGEIFISGELVTETPTYKREIGIVFQNYSLFPHMTVESNVGYGLRARGVKAEEIAVRVNEALELVKLSGFEKRKPKQLSGGQQQRVALARALVLRPKVLLLDEPFSALDKNLRASMQIELKEIQSKLGVTTIFVTHDQSEALSMSDRIAVMSAGKIRQIGTPMEVYEHPSDEFVASFIGDVNVFAGRVGEAGRIAIGETEIALPEAKRGSTSGSSVRLFARPEHLRLVNAEMAGSLQATVQTLVYQGSHIDVHLACASAESGRIMVRVPSAAVSEKLAVGAPVGLQFVPEKLNIFNMSE